MGVVVSSVGLLKFYRLANCLCCTGPSVFSTDLEKESVLLASTAGFWLALLSVGLTGQRSWNDSKKPFQLRTTTELLRKKIQQDAPLEAFINGSRIWMVIEWALQLGSIAGGMAAGAAVPPGGCERSMPFVAMARATMALRGAKLPSKRHPQHHHALPGGVLPCALVCFGPTARHCSYPLESRDSIPAKELLLILLLILIGFSFR